MLSEFLLVILSFTLPYVMADGGNTTYGPSSNSIPVVVKLNEIDGFYFAMITAQVSLWSGLIGSMYVFYRTFLRWRSHNYEPLAIAVRYPFYIAITDFLICVTNIFNSGYSLIKLELLSGFICTFIGWITFFVAVINITLVGSLALTTYLRICHRIVIDLGRYDWRMQAVVYTFSFLVALIPTGEYGPSQWWCAESPKDMTVPYILLVIVNGTILCVFYFYIRILMKIRLVGRTLLLNNADSSKTSLNEQKVTRKIASYVLIFLIQWGSNLIYQILALSGVRVTWILLFQVMAPGAGGLGNAFQYMLNEGWSKNHSTTVQGSSKESDQNVTETDDKPSNHEIIIIN